MEFKRGRIIKIIPGLNPNCSSGMFAVGYTIISIPIYLVINVVTSVVVYKKRGKARKKEAIDIFSISKSIWRLKYLILLAAVIWMGFLVVTLSAELHYGYIGTWIVAGLMISYPPISLIISVLIGERVLCSKRPKGIFIISPISYLVIVLILWLSSGLIYSLVYKIVDTL